MEIKKIGNYEFVNDWCNTRTGFAHKTTLFLNQVEIGSYKVNYYNRTWESYTYQIVMKACINDIIEKMLVRYLNNFKYENNIVRFKKGQKAELEKEFEKLEKVKSLRNLYNEL